MQNLPHFLNVERLRTEKKEKIKEQQAADKKLKDYQVKYPKITNSEEYKALEKQVEVLKKEKENLEALYF